MLGILKKERKNKGKEENANLRRQMRPLKEMNLELHEQSFAFIFSIIEYQVFFSP